jgi:hypothetical protein
MLGNKSPAPPVLRPKGRGIKPQEIKHRGAKEDITGADLSGLQIRTGLGHTWLKIPEASITDDFPGPGGFTVQPTNTIYVDLPLLPPQSPPEPKPPVGSPVPDSPPIEVTLSLFDHTGDPITANNNGSPIGIMLNQFITVELEISNTDPPTRVYPRIVAYDTVNSRWNTDNYFYNDYYFTFDEYPQPETDGGDTYRFTIAKRVLGYIDSRDLALGIIFQESDSDLHRVAINGDSSINPVDFPEIDPDTLGCIFMINFNSDGERILYE